LKNTHLAANLLRDRERRLERWSQT
jgi:hypothetical protein